MDEPAAFSATYHNTKNVLGRKVLQVILEVPIEKSAQVYDVLGWPDPATPIWVGVARLQEPDGA